MMFPFSFWGNDPFAGLTQTLQLNEDFSDWFAQWLTVTQTLQLTENFNAYFDTIWNATVENLELSEDFNSW